MIAGCIVALWCQVVLISWCHFSPFFSGLLNAWIFSFDFWVWEVCGVWIYNYISLSYKSEGLYYSLIGYFKYLVLCKENCTSLSSYWGIMFERSMLVEPFVLFCFSFKTKVMEFQNIIGLTSIPRSALSVCSCLPQFIETKELFLN